MSRSASTFQVLLVLATTVAQTQWASVSGMYCNDLTPNVERPHSASITDFGAVGDGTTLNTKAFQNALFYLNSFANKGGAQLFVPAGRWLTGSFSLISHLTLSLDKDAVILGSPDSSDWPVIDALPSYGRGRELPGKRHQSLIFGSNLTDVIITGANSTIDGQGAIWWDWFHNHTLNYTRPPLVELMYSTRVVISNLTFINSPFWNIHPVYCSQVLVQHLTILAPISSPNTDGIDPDSSTNVCIEDCYIRNGDDIVVIKSGWDEYGISFAHPSSNISIRNITGQTRNSAGIAFGSEMSGGISDVRAEGIRIVNSVHGIRIKTAPGRGGYVKNVYVADVNLDNVSIAIRITGNYGEHPDENYNRNALPTISNITIKNIVGVNIGVAGMLQGISGDNFSNICLSNVSLSVRSTNPWNCSLVEGYSNSVSPEICEQLRTGPGPGQVCYDGNSYPAAAAQPQSPQKSSACRLGLLRNFIIPNPPAEPAYMGQRLAVASTSEDQLDQRPATADVDSTWSSYGSTIRSISFPQGVGWSAWLRQSGGSGTTPGSSLLSSCTDGSRPSSSASSWGSGAAGFNAIKANELRLIARRMVRDGHLQVLTREFLGGGNGVLQGWFTELDVDWVLTMTEDMSWRAEQMVVHDRARRWIRAFTTMAHAFLAIRSDLRHAVEGANEQELQLSGFASASISKMMLFVDAVIANVDWTPENLPVALDVYICISDTTASSHDQASSTAQQIVLSIYGATAHHTRRRRLAAAIHRAMRSLLVDYYGDGGSCRAPRGSELHATTRYTMDFVRLLWRNAGLASSVLDDDGSGSVVLLVSDVMRCWEFSLVSASMLLPDATLRCVFLLNNYDAMAEAFPDSGLHDEIGRCMEHYLDAAWAPVLSCLHSAPVWPPSAKLANFTARFWRTYNAQKLWRVPSPALRGRLRRAVAGLVISAYAMYLKEHPLRDKDRVSIMAPEEMEEILNELFEG